MPVRALLGFALLSLLASACGESEGADGRSTGGGAGSGGSATGGAPSGGTGGATSGGAGGVGGAPSGGSAGTPSDSGADADDGGPFVADAGLFACGGCACDGATHYCVSFVGGLLPPAPPDAAACPDVTTPGASGCHPLPTGCNGVPACGCLPSPMPGYSACHCDDTGGGLTYSCAMP